MADRKVFRDHLSDKTAMRSPVETQRTIDFLLAEHAKLIDRVAALEAEIGSTVAQLPRGGKVR